MRVERIKGIHQELPKIEVGQEILVKGDAAVGK
jgi:hypothetical protein